MTRRFFELTAALYRHLKNGTVVWIGEGKKAETLAAFFRELGRKRCRRIKGVISDLGWRLVRAGRQSRDDLPRSLLVARVRTNWTDAARACRSGVTCFPGCPSARPCPRSTGAITPSCPNATSSSSARSRVQGPLPGDTAADRGHHRGQRVRAPSASTAHSSEDRPALDGWPLPAHATYQCRR